MKKFLALIVLWSCISTGKAQIFQNTSIHYTRPTSTWIDTRGKGMAFLVGSGLNRQYAEVQWHPMSSWHFAANYTQGNWAEVNWEPLFTISSINYRQKSGGMNASFRYKEGPFNFIEAKVGLSTTSLGYMEERENIPFLFENDEVTYDTTTVSAQEQAVDLELVFHITKKWVDTYAGLGMGFSQYSELDFDISRFKDRKWNYAGRTVSSTSFLLGFNGHYRNFIIDLQFRLDQQPDLLIKDYKENQFDSEREYVAAGWGGSGVLKLGYILDRK